MQSPMSKGCPWQENTPTLSVCRHPGCPRKFRSPRNAGPVLRVCARSAESDSGHAGPEARLPWGAQIVQQIGWVDAAKLNVIQGDNGVIRAIRRRVPGSVMAGKERVRGGSKRRETRRRDDATWGETQKRTQRPYRKWRRVQREIKSDQIFWLSFEGIKTRTKFSCTHRSNFVWCVCICVRVCVSRGWGGLGFVMPWIWPEMTRWNVTRCVTGNVRARWFARRHVASRAKANEHEHLRKRFVGLGGQHRDHKTCLMYEANSETCDKNPVWLRVNCSKLTKFFAQYFYSYLQHIWSR